MEPLMTSDEVAAFLRVDVVTIRRLVNRGELPAYRVGGEYRFMRSDLTDYLQRQRISGSEPSGSDPLDVVFSKLARKFFPDKPLPRTDMSRFTKRAHRVLALAQEEARRLHHHYIGTEHLLLGLLREGEGLAAQVLQKLGVTLDEARNRVEFIVGQGDHEATGEFPLTPRAKKVLHLAVEETARLGHQFVGTEHLLLGLIREGEGIAAGVLKNLGVTLEKARAETIQLVHARLEAQPLPAEATLVADDQEALTCDRCGARCPVYFRYCFHCGQLLAED